ncbi:MAG: MFS transporter [Phycisphaerales bacterium]|nr:MFS transporter [Phycisphaerales bacterium]
MSDSPSNSVEGALVLARLDRIPIWPYRRSLLVIVGFGFFFCFFDIITIGAVIPVLKTQWDVSDSLLAWTITASLVGYVIGEFIVGRIADRFGRRLALYISVTFFSVGSILSATSPSLWWLVGWRLMSGMGIGAELSSTTTYLGEMAPRKIRGHVTAIGVGCGFLGFAVVPFISMALIPNFDWGWRAIFIIGGIIGIFIFIMRRRMPETPRWLVAHGRVEEAEKIIAAAEILAEKRLKKKLPKPLEKRPTLVANKHWLNLLKPPYLIWVILFSGIWSAYYIGNYAWLTLTPQLYQNHGISLPAAFFVQGCTSLGFVFGAILAVFLGDRIERKWLASIIALLWCVCLLLVGWFPSIWIIMVCGFAASTSIAIFIPIVYTYTAETFPVWGRATGISMTDGIGHITAAFCGQIIFGISAIYESSGYSFQAAFTVMAISGLLTVFLLLFGPCKTGQSLDDAGSLVS